MHINTKVDKKYTHHTGSGTYHPHTDVQTKGTSSHVLLKIHSLFCEQPRVEVIVPIQVELRGFVSLTLGEEEGFNLGLNL